jgi:hypothetical protein
MCVTSSHDPHLPWVLWSCVPCNRSASQHIDRVVNKLTLRSTTPTPHVYNNLHCHAVVAALAAAAAAAAPAAAAAAAAVAAVTLSALLYPQVPGSSCLRLPECHHFYCRTCLSAAAAAQLDGGAVENMRCPEPSCRRLLPPYVVKELLGDSDFAR